MNNREQEEKLKAYQEMLRTGQIDETTYYSMIQRNLGNPFQVLKPKTNKKRLLLVVFLMCLFFYGVYYYQTNNNVIKEYEYISSYYDIPAPVQNDYIGSTTMQVNNSTVRVDYISTYEVSGRVVAKATYTGNTVSKKMAKRDIALVWGKLATDEYLNKIRWSAPGNRFVYWRTKDMDWFRANTNDAEITSMYSNNHLITIDKDMIKIIASIKKDDYIKIKGYLVNLYWEENNENRNWFSSTTRTDDGDGACEVIYVTEIKWLKEY